MTSEVPENEPTRRQWTGFWCMIVQQAQNAFSDKLAQFTLIPLGGAVAFSLLIPVGAGIDVDVASAVGLLMALPMVLFAPVAGWVSDRFSKRDVMLGAAMLQAIVLAVICLAVFLKNMPLGLFGVFALAVQSAFFSPAKIGINKELVGSKHLGFAAGIQQMTAMLAILAGQIFAGWLFDHRFRGHGGGPEAAWPAALNPMLVLAALAVPAILLAWIIPRVPAQGGAAFTKKLAVSHFLNLADLWRDAPLRRASFGVAFFWGFAAFINLWSVKLAKLMTGGGEGNGTQASIFMASASLGMAGGFGFASWLLRKRIELGWVPVAGVAMTFSALALAFMTPGSWLFLATLALLAFSAAVFLAPLTAWMQDRYPAAKRGELQSAVNLQDCFAGIFAVLAIGVFEYITRAFSIPPSEGFRFEIGFIGVVCGLMTLSIFRLLPGDFIRLVGGALIRTIYQIKVINANRIPAKGGALLLPNHVTFADAFFISAACPLPVRFVMDEVFMERRAIRIFVSIFNTVTIRRDQPLEAIRTTISALKSGDLVCLFPEGQLTRTGTLSELRRGFELIAKKAGHPLIPMWCDGSWGSIFSFEGGSFLRKRPHKPPYRITIAFGEEISPRQATTELVRNSLLRASAEAIDGRFSPPKPSRDAPDGDAARRIRVNGYQIGQLNALQWRTPFQVLAADSVSKQLPGLFLAFPEQFGAKAETRDTVGTGVWVGGDTLRDALETTGPADDMVFYDFSRRANIPLERSGMLHLPCLAIDGKVVAMSMPHPPKNEDADELQPGWKTGSWGKLLPGWYADGGRVFGPAAPDGLALPEGAVLDAEGFVIPE